MAHSRYLQPSAFGVHGKILSPGSWDWGNRRDMWLVLDPMLGDGRGGKWVTYNQFWPMNWECKNLTHAVGWSFEWLMWVSLLWHCTAGRNVCQTCVSVGWALQAKLVAHRYEQERSWSCHQRPQVWRCLLLQCSLVQIQRHKHRRTFIHSFLSLGNFLLTRLPKRTLSFDVRHSYVHEDAIHGKNISDGDVFRTF